MWEIRRYRETEKELWDEFVSSSRNATFLFYRDYMDYHADRFADHSLLGYRKGKLAAILPANITEKTLHSHQGLTCGGWLLPQSGLDGGEIASLWKAWMEYCAAEKIEKVIYKPLPYIYAGMPSQEDLYMLYKAGAQLVQTDLSTTMDLACNPGFNKLQRRHLAHIPETVKIEVGRAGDEKLIQEFHKMLAECLAERHEATPVHTAQELALLMQRFPENIQLRLAVENGTVTAGICEYITPDCVHCQYIGTTLKGREQNVLAKVVKEIADEYVAKGVRYLDFGTSNEDGGKVLNEGLNRQKTSYGGSGVAYQRWEISVDGAAEKL
ncbi:MAG: GNAT family N-acetyltransferase [Muribaculaceae bacterium]|nr:GNAT family N-acetyltransferase [Muribaculaceae bacterium]